jgi:hypothetical protein
MLMLALGLQRVHKLARVARAVLPAIQQVFSFSIKDK